MGAAAVRSTPDSLVGPQEWLKAEITDFSGISSPSSTCRWLEASPFPSCLGHYLYRCPCRPPSNSPRSGTAVPNHCSPCGQRCDVIRYASCLLFSHHAKVLDWRETWLCHASLSIYANQLWAEAHRFHDAASQRLTRLTLGLVRRLSFACRSPAAGITCGRHEVAVRFACHPIV